jgi:hypothetical protein
MSIKSANSAATKAFENAVRVAAAAMFAFGAIVCVFRYQNVPVIIAFVCATSELLGRPLPKGFFEIVKGGAKWARGRLEVNSYEPGRPSPPAKHRLHAQAPSEAGGVSRKMT